MTFISFLIWPLYELRAGVRNSRVVEIERVKEEKKVETNLMS